MNTEENEQSRLNERFVRWQENLRSSLSSYTTLIMSWSAGGLAFCGALLNSDHAKFGGITTLVFKITGGLLIICLLLAIFISWNRLEDTRKTLKLLKSRKNKGSKETIDELEKITDKLGDSTWCAVRLQLGFFALAAIFLVITVLLAFKDRLDTGS